MAIIDSPRDASSAFCFGCGESLVFSRESLLINGYEVHRCPGCASLVTWPLPSPETLRSYYREYNTDYSARMGANRYQSEMPKRWRARIRTLRKLGARGRLLDVGGGNGMFGEIAAESRFDISIADFVPRPVRLGFTTVVPADLGEIGGLPYPSDTFDVVTLWSCIEHLLDPSVGLAEICRVCRPGGLVAIDTPLVGDLCERWWAARTHWLTPPEHLNLFSEAGLEKAVRRAGLEVVVRSPFYERTPVRWVARRGRNLALAAVGALYRAISVDGWKRARSAQETPAGDIQVLIGRKPLKSW